MFDLEKDPGQLNPIEDREVETRLLESLRTHLKEADAPAEQFERLGL